MGGQVSRTDFEWTETKQPHPTRRDEILKKYPEIKKLFGHDPRMKWTVSLLVITQLAMIPLVSNLRWTYVLFLAYCFGGVINHCLMMVIHELSHNMAFGYSRPTANRLFGIWANLPIGLPISVSFKKYHLEHHRYLSDELLDVDVPTALEAKLFCNTIGKLCWVTLQPFFYALRPLIVYPKQPCRMEVLNFVVQIIFNCAVYQFFGGKVLFYLIGGSLMAMGFHPVAGHFIAEHYMFERGYETYSYYGIINYVTWNVGYHNEHHDFPAVPACHLPKVREIAKEYYDALPHHTSMVGVLYDFITDPAIGPYARIKRRNQDLLKRQDKVKNLPYIQTNEE